MQRFETKTTERVARALDRIPSMGGLMLLTGPHGIGKSTAIDMAMADRETVRRVLMTPPAERSTARTFYAEIATALGIEVGHNWTGAIVARAVTAEIQRHRLTVVLDNVETFGAPYLKNIRHLADLVDHVVLCGSPAAREKLAQDSALRTRLRLPVQAEAVSLPELVGFFGAEFSEDWLMAVQEETAGLWSSIWTLVEWQRVAERNTRDAGADDARQASQMFLVKAA